MIVRAVIAYWVIAEVVSDVSATHVRADLVVAWLIAPIESCFVDTVVAHGIYVPLIVVVHVKGTAVVPRVSDVGLRDSLRDGILLEKG